MKKWCGSFWITWRRWIQRRFRSDTFAVCVICVGSRVESQFPSLYFLLNCYGVQVHPIVSWIAVAPPVKCRRGSETEIADQFSSADRKRGEICGDCLGPASCRRYRVMPALPADVGAAAG